MTHCNVCDNDVGGELERARVRSNVRKFRDENFEVWRCPECRSIHAAEEVDLGHYYAEYPFHKLAETDVDWMLGAMYGNLLKRLQRHGFAPDQSLIDYGCGSGHFLKLLASRGYRDVAGFDEYSDHYADRSVLDRKYDVAMSQDVLEHVESPREHMRDLGALAKPGGLVVIGTPNADSIDLADPEPRVHTLHQPYHRHIVSAEALRAMGQELGWELVHYYPTMYSNTRVPFVNTPFVTHYFRCFDNTVDLALEPIKFSSWKLWTPHTLWHAFAGSFFAPESDVMAVFRLPTGEKAESHNRSGFETH